MNKLIFQTLPESIVDKYFPGAGSMLQMKKVILSIPRTTHTQTLFYLVLIMSIVKAMPRAGRFPVSCPDGLEGSHVLCIPCGIEPQR
jgi:hypothetical protein